MFYIELIESSEEVNSIKHSYIYMPEINGLSVSNPKLSLEYGKAGSLSFSMSVTHPLISKIKPLKSTVAVGLQERVSATKNEIWRGRVLSTTEDMYGNLSVTCEGALAWLNDILLEPTIQMEYSDVYEYLGYIISKYNARNRFPERSINGVGMDLDVEKLDPVLITRDDYNSAWYEMNNYMITNYGGAFFLSVEEYDGVYLDWITEPPDMRGDPYAKLEYGFNLSNFQMDADITELATNMYLDVYDNNDEFAFTTQVGLQNEIEEYGEIEIAGKLKTYLRGDSSDDDLAYNMAHNFLKKRVEKSISIQAEGIDPMFRYVYKHYTTPLLTVGSIVDVIIPGRKFKNGLLIQKIDYDLTNPANTSYSLGNPPSTLSGEVANKKLTDEIQVISNTY